MSRRVQSKRPSKKARVEVVLDEPLWKLQLASIKKMCEGVDAPVYRMGAHSQADAKLPKELSDFHVLVGALLSSQSQDIVTYSAMQRLKAFGLTVDNILEANVHELAQIIKPVGFYNRKAENLKKICQILRDRYSDKIPSSVESLMALPGIGPKMAFLIMNIVSGEPHGICVDTHVHRISNRLDWVRNTKTPEETREELESWLPKCHWHGINRLLVAFGQTTCKAQRPNCSECLLKDTCKCGKKAKR